MSDVIRELMIAIVSILAVIYGVALVAGYLVKDD